MGEKNKGGRPKLTEPKTEPFGFRATKMEAEKIQTLAKARGISPGAFCRVVSLEKKLPPEVTPEINRQTWTELSKIGNNLNQISKHFNQGVSDPELKSILDELKIQVRKTQLEVLGADESGIKKSFERFLEMQR